MCANVNAPLFVNGFEPCFVVSSLVRFSVPAREGHKPSAKTHVESRHCRNTFDYFKISIEESTKTPRHVGQGMGPFEHRSCISQAFALVY